MTTERKIGEHVYRCEKQPASVTGNATGLAEVAAQVKASVLSAMGSLGPSMVKANSIPTGGGTASTPSP